jgi:small conductance mechanosensitive channel
MKHLLLVFLLLLTPCAATAQSSAAAPSREEAAALVKVLENDAERAKLLAQLKTITAVQSKVQEDNTPAGWVASMLAQASDSVARAGEDFTQALRGLNDLPLAWANIVALSEDPDRLWRWGRLAGQIGVVLGAALIGEWLVFRLLRRFRLLLARRQVSSVAGRALVFLGRTVLDALPIVVFGGLALVVLGLLDPDRVARLVVTTLINANVVLRIVLAAGRAVLSPDSRHFRLISLSDETANYLYLWLRRVAGTALYGFMALDALRYIGIGSALGGVLEKLTGLLLAGMLIVLVLQNREAVAHVIREGGREGRLKKLAGSMMSLRRRLADVWHVLAIVYVVAVFAVWAMDIPGGFTFLLRATALTVLLLGLLRLVVRTLRRLVRAGFTVRPETARRFPGLEDRANRYLPVLDVALRVGLYFIAAVMLLQIWGMDSLRWLTEGAGRRLVSSAIVIGLVLALAAVIWESASSMIERYLNETDDSGQVRQRSARVRTLLPLLRNALLVMLVVFTGLIVLAELGVNIAPLLAGAGVVGLAIGFGSQTLVKDVITGLFILFEDTISVGDVIEVGGLSGTVEGITIRTLRLRDAQGAVLTIPFSNVTSIKNMTKNFSFALFDLSVDYSTDLNSVTEALKEVDDAVRKDPAFSPNILAPLEIFGLDSFLDSAIVVKARIKTAPGKQWGIRREMNRRIKEAFDARGISIPFPQRVVHHVMDPGAPRPPALEE